ncbi:GNAT family N-acetyltransferase [Sediminicurvatus halobius]|uniref:N-acetyltransferase n=1 Tax=Sediminicurvatus halobius TaxID=2182432 RepID=A0A2U2MXJ0_9GAMM|nr:GNAT family N-acetyltransferase [Spiribacter halobius]PWG61556.1 N-acetyltransferase [Spiribacter halobius]UEX77125.1 GNAT family N-acetyltransferase [Spiribacter halobius]
MAEAAERALRIRRAEAADCGLILALIRELAEYERLAHEVVADEALLRKHLFGPQPAAEVLLAEAGDEPVGFALFFTSFSTFLGRPGLYLEDLFVRPAHRGQGYGQALIGALARLALERGCGRLEWSVLDWNTPAIGFYRALGAEPMDEWTTYRVTGAALERLGNGGGHA